MEDDSAFGIFFGASVPVEDQNVTYVHLPGAYESKQAFLSEYYWCLNMRIEMKTVVINHDRVSLINERD